jgi:hypothetical protein
MSTPKTRSALALALAFTLAGALPAHTAHAQQPFALSSKFMEASLVGQAWSGEHAFDPVLCLTFPRVAEVSSLAQAMYNNNSLYFSRATYPDLTALYVVASTVPAGRAVEVEMANLAASNQRAIDLHPKHFSQSKAEGALGPSLLLTVRNALEGGKESPFPFVRNIDARVGAPLASVSVHRLFVRGPDRLELAGLRYFKTPVGAEGEAAAIAELATLVEQAADSLQACTHKLPLRVPRP